MAKKGFASKEDALRAIALHGRLGSNLVPFCYRDPLTSERKWFIRKKPRPRRS